MKFVLEITCENDAFMGGARDRNREVARILRNTAQLLEAPTARTGDFPLLDTNGNSVGHAEFFERDFA